jgi:hypothetical protein
VSSSIGTLPRAPSRHPWIIQHGARRNSLAPRWIHQPIVKFCKILVTIPDNDIINDREAGPAVAVVEEVIHNNNKSSSDDDHDAKETRCIKSLTTTRDHVVSESTRWYHFSDIEAIERRGWSIFDQLSIVGNSFLHCGPSLFKPAKRTRFLCQGLILDRHR